MPFTLPLRDVPLPLNERHKIVKPDGTATSDFLSKQREWEAWADRVQTALKELEP